MYVCVYVCSELQREVDFQKEPTLSKLSVVPLQKQDGAKTTQDVEMK